MDYSALLNLSFHVLPWGIVCLRSAGQNGAEWVLEVCPFFLFHVVFTAALQRGGLAPVLQVASWKLTEWQNWVRSQELQSVYH